MPEIQLPTSIHLHYLDIPPGSTSRRGIETVLLLHGLGATGASWQLQIPALAGVGYRVLAPDARGFGDSTYPGGSGSIREMAGDFAALLSALGIERVHLIGISMGGTHALQLALDHPALVERLVLVNTFAALRPSSLRQAAYFALRFALVHTLGIKTQARAVANRLFPRPDQAELRSLLIEQITQADPSGYRAAMRALARFNVEKRLPEVNIPTLVITGALDSTVSSRTQERLAAGIPGARHVIIPDAGHAVIVDRPESFNRIVLEFLNSPSAHPITP